MREAFIDSVGAVTAIGRNTTQTLRSLEAGISRCRLSPYVSSSGAPYVVAPVVEVRPDLTGIERATLLARPAFEECLRGLTLRGRFGRMIALDFGGPAKREKIKTPNQARLYDLRKQYEQLVDAVRGWLVEYGVQCDTVFAASLGHDQIRVLEACVESDTYENFLWAGVSSACEPPRLEKLDLDRAIRPPARRYPIVGGEAAAVVALSRHQPSRRRLVWATAKEPNWADTTPSDGAVLTAVLRDVLTRPAAMTESPRLLHDIPDAPALMHEWTMATVRNFDVLRHPSPALRPATQLGQTGAATLPLYAALASASEVPSTVAVITESFRRSALRVDRL